MLGDYQLTCCNDDCDQGHNCPVRKKVVCDRLLANLFPNQQDMCEKWWNSPNKAFSDLEPIRALDQNPQTVVQYLYSQFSGDYL